MHAPPAPSLGSPAPVGGWLPCGAAAARAGGSFGSRDAGLAVSSAGSRADGLVRTLLGAVRDGVRTQAVLFEGPAAGAGAAAAAGAVAGLLAGSAGPLRALAAEVLLEVLLAVCRADASAECLLLCERRHLHSPEFGRLVRLSPEAADDDELWRRIHIKYVLPPATAGAAADAAAPPLIEVLAALQNLSFVPAVVAVFNLSELVRPRAPEALRGFRCGTLEFQLLALATSLLIDAAAHLPRRAWSAEDSTEQGALALLWEVLTPPPAFAATAAADALSGYGDSGPGSRGGLGSGFGSSLGLGLLGSVLDAVWRAEEAPPSLGQPPGAFQLKRLF